jgi:hypothetical protein
LHARIEGVQPDSWEHPSLVQTWAPRGAVYTVPSDDLWVFAQGIRPRDPGIVKAGRADRLSAAASGVPIRWNTRTTVLLPRRELSGDPEGARLELARRYLRSLGPGDARRFQRFAAVGRADAEYTFAALAPELVEVEVERNGSGFVLASDLEMLMGAPAVEGARLLPQGADPVLQPIESWLFGARPTGGHLELLGIDLPSWCIGGILLLHGETVGSFGRTGGTFVLVALKKIGTLGRRLLEAEAWSAPLPGGVARVVWRQLE